MRFSRLMCNVYFMIVLLTSVSVCVCVCVCVHVCACVCVCCIIKVFHDEKVLMKRSWVEADFFCQALGAKLAAFHHHEEQVFVKRLLSTMFEGFVQPPTLLPN